VSPGLSGRRAEATVAPPSPAREKHDVALASVLAAVALTALKGVVGVTTGSLGILSEALHSLLDLAAAVLTLAAVRASARPADERHPYGHGKFENVSALVEAMLLVATCAWILVEAVDRLFVTHVHVEVTVWSFAVMLTSIAVDATRARALSRTAEKYQSRALEADALHFATDVWSSGVVILGLAGVLLARPLGAPWLAKADAVAALGVAAIVVWITIGLGRRTLADLLDESPPGLRDTIAAALRLPGVVEVARVRARRSGPESFVDVTLRVDAGTTMEHAHAIADMAEDAVHRLLPASDVVVHVEPVTGSAAAGEGHEFARARELASRLGLGAHDVHVRDVLGSRYLELHLEVPADLDVAAAHDRASAFEDRLRQELPSLARIVTHIEPLSSPGRGQRPPGPATRQVLEEVRRVVSEESPQCQPHDIAVHDEQGRLHVSFHCSVQRNLPITDAHELTERLERALRARLPWLGRVVIHVEPQP